MKKLLSLALLVLLAMPLSSCSDSDDDDDGGGALSVTFSPATTAPPANSISLQRNSVNGASFTVDVVITDVTDLYGVAYTLTYSPQVLHYAGFSRDPDNHMTTGGVNDAFSAALEGNVEGRLVVGHSRVGNVTGVSGSGTLHRLTFLGQAAGTTNISFEAVRLANSQGGVIPGVQAFGGSATVSGGQ